MAALHSFSAANISTRNDMKSILTVDDPGGNTSVGGLYTLCHNRDSACVLSGGCGQHGHFARNCPSLAPCAEQTLTPKINALAQDEALLSLFQRQERVQELLLAGHARLEQQDARFAAAELPNVVTPLAQMAAPPPPRAPLIIGGAQPDEYIYVGLNQGQSVWAHADIIQVSVGGSQSGGQ